MFMFSFQRKRNAGEIISFHYLSSSFNRRIWTEVEVWSTFFSSFHLKYATTHKHISPWCSLPSFWPRGLLLMKESRFLRPFLQISCFREGYWSKCTWWWGKCYPEIENSVLAGIPVTDSRLLTDRILCGQGSYIMSSTQLGALLYSYIFNVNFWRVQNIYLTFIPIQSRVFRQSGHSTSLQHTYDCQVSETYLSSG